MSYLKSPLPFDQYERYQIDQMYLAFQLAYTEITLERVDEIEIELQQEGYKLFHTETTQHKGKFDAVFIVGKGQLLF